MPERVSTDDETEAILAALELLQDIEQDRYRVLVAACGDDSGSVSRKDEGQRVGQGARQEISGRSLSQLTEAEPC